MLKPIGKPKAEILHDVGKILRLWRAEKEMTQSDVASEIGISPQQYQKYETGNSSIELSRMFELCSVFGKSPSELIQSNDTTGKPQASPIGLGIDDIAQNEELVSQADLSFQISELVAAYMAIQSPQDRMLAMQLIKRLSSAA